MNFYIYFLAFLLLLMDYCFANIKELKLVTDDELLSLIRMNKVVVLFTKPNCEVCNKYESELVKINEDLYFLLDASVVKSLNSQLLKVFSQNSEPTVLFFRHGIPILYEGDIDGELMLNEFSNNMEPVVKELTDATFEHLTQASTGATTGDWFIMFYGNHCQICHKLQPLWEAVGAKLKMRLNVARVNFETTGRKTSKRLKVGNVPKFVFFKNGYMYEYLSDKYTIDSFIEFTEFYPRMSKAEKVPDNLSYLDELLESMYEFIKENNQTHIWVKLILGVSIFSTTLYVGYKYSRSVVRKQDKLTKMK